VIGRLFGDAVLTRCPRCAWSQRLRLRMGQVRTTHCELCGQGLRTLRLPVGVSVQPLDAAGVPIPYTLHVRAQQWGRWL
jgi:hypothetical protein